LAPDQQFTPDYPTQCSQTGIMKLLYIGIIRNDSKPAHEIVAEKELSAYSRFTRNKFVPRAICSHPARR